MSAETLVQDRGPLAARLASWHPIFGFIRRDLLTLASYGFGLVAEWGALVLQLLMLSFVARLMDPSAMPLVSGKRPSYLAFVTIGIGVSSLMQVGVARVAGAIRQEQLTGTFEQLLTVSTPRWAIQIGSAAFDLAYSLLRVCVFVLVAAVALGLPFEPAGVLPALVLAALFLSSIWGFGLLSAGLIVTYRRGSGMVGMLSGLVAGFSGAYFPIELLPGWAYWLVVWNPIAIALDGIRAALIGGVANVELVPVAGALLGWSLVMIPAGMMCFQWSLAREMRRGTLGLY